MLEDALCTLTKNRFLFLSKPKGHPDEKKTMHGLHGLKAQKEKNQITDKNGEISDDFGLSTPLDPHNPSLY